MFEDKEMKEKNEEDLKMAKEKPWLRFPNVDLNIHYNYEQCHIFIETFIRNINSNKIVKTSIIHTCKHFSWVELEIAKDRFNKHCFMIQQNYIFIDNTSIVDPYEKNKKL